MTVADRIKFVRESSGLTQDELAKKMGYASKSAISRTENAGDNIGNKRIKEFAKALNVSVAFLMGWNDDMDLINDTANEDIIISEEEKEMIHTYRMLDEEARRQLVLMLAFLKDQSNKK